MKSMIQLWFRWIKILIGNVQPFLDDNEQHEKMSDEARKNRAHSRANNKNVLNDTLKRKHTDRVNHQKEGIFMPKNKFQDAIFTIIMATVMVYGMIVYNVALNTGGVTGKTFLMALHEMPIMVPVAFVLEFFVVGKLARMLAFKVMRPDDRPQFITYAISICICCIMCPIMSLIATILFKENRSFGTFIQTWGMNFPMALLYQMFYCGPFVRLIFRSIFREKK